MGRQMCKHICYNGCVYTSFSVVFQNSLSPVPQFSQISRNWPRLFLFSPHALVWLTVVSCLPCHFAETASASHQLPPGLHSGVSPALRARSMRASCSSRLTLFPGPGSAVFWSCSSLPVSRLLTSFWPCLCLEVLCL